MALGILRSYFQETSIHGFHYVGEAGSLHKRLIWATLIIISFTMAALLMRSNLRDTKENPFVTSITTVPVQEVPYPAVSVHHSHFKPPWSVFSTLLLNAASFDCLGKEATDCRRSQKLLDDFAVLIRERVQLMFDKVYDAFTNHTIGATISSLKICGRLKELFVDLEEERKCILRALKTSITPKEARLLFRTLAPRTFRQPKQIFGQSVREALGCHGNDSTTYQCINVVYYVHADVFSSLAGWIFSQGGVEPALSLGDVVWSKDMWRPERQWAGSTEAITLNKLTPAFKALVPNFENPLSLAKSMIDFLTQYSSQFFSPVLFKYLLDWDCAMGSNDVRLKCDKDYAYDDEHFGCCDLSRELSRRYRFVLRTMKYFSRGAWQVHESGDLGDVLAGLRHLGYDAKSDRELVHLWHTLPILSTIFLGDSKNTTEMPFFSRWFSMDKGIAYTFNHMPFWKMYKKSQAMEAFHDEVHRNYRDANRLWHPQGNGNKYAFETFLLSGSAEAHVTLHDPSLLPDFETMSILLLPGKTYRISVTPTLSKMDDVVHKLSPEVKGCLSKSDPHQLVLFRDYSHSSCMFECRLRRAFDTCGCIPWDYPQLAENGTICNMHTESWFKEEMGGVATSEECNCPPNC